MAYYNPWKQGGYGQGDYGQGGYSQRSQNGWGNGPHNPFGSNSNKVEFKVPEKWRQNRRKYLIIAVAIAVVVIAFLYWLFHPSLNIHNPNLWIFVCIVVMLPMWLIFRGWRSTYEKGTPAHPQDSRKAKKYGKLCWIPIAVVIIGLVGALCSATFFPGNAQRYASVLTTEELEFSTDIEEVDYDQIPVIDRESAIILGNRAMGTMSDYISQFEISDLYSQINYQDTPVRVSPLNYANIIKWFTNHDEGIPGYVVVDMTTQDTEVVRLDEGIHYSESEPFFKNINRYVQLKYPTYMFDEFSFEIDEDGTPYWICPVRDYTIGLFGGKTISRVVLCNACTGECESMAIEDVPEWVDRAYPTELLVQQYNWSGLYSNGWWNSWLGQDGVKQTTPGSDGSLGYNYIAKDDDVWVYTGVTSVTSDNSIIGFVLINQRTAESHFYSVSGATEDSAMSSAEGQVQNLEYTATFPLLLNINGQPTYFMALKDDAGLVKKYAMVDIQRYQNVAVGDTVSECQSTYKALLATNGVIDEDETAEDDTALEVTGKIATMVQAVVDSDSHFYITLEGDSTIYDVPISVIEIVTYQEGDTITLQYYAGDETATVTAISEAASG